MSRSSTRAGQSSQDIDYVREGLTDTRRGHDKRSFRKLRGRPGDMLHAENGHKHPGSPTASMSTVHDMQTGQHTLTLT